MLRIDLNSGPLARPWRDNTIGALYELARRIPGQPAMLDIGRQSLLLLQDASDIRQVLRDKSGLYRKSVGAFEGVFGESRFSTDGPRWSYLQGLSQPHISAAPAASVTDSAGRAFSAAVAELLETRDRSGAVTVDRAINHAAARVVCEVAFGLAPFDIDALLTDFRDMLRFGAQRNWNVDGDSRAGPEELAAYGAAEARMRQALAQLVSRNAEAEPGSQLVRDIAAGEAEGVDVTREMASLLFAGFDTTAAAIGWGLFLLAATPDLQHHLRARLREGIGAGPLDAEGLSEVGELSAFVDEVLRIFPPVPVLARIATGPDELAGARIAEGQRVLISLIGLHHDPRIFPSPARVVLTRSADPEASRRLRGHQLPFGDGRRACGGLRVANIELRVAFATLLRSLEFNLADQDPLAFEWTASLRRKGGHRLLVRPAP